MSGPASERSLVDVVAEVMEHVAGLVALHGVEAWSYYAKHEIPNTIALRSVAAALDDLQARDYTIIKVGSVPEWMEESGAIGCWCPEDPPEGGPVKHFPSCKGPTALYALRSSDEALEEK